MRRYAWLSVADQDTCRRFLGCGLLVTSDGTRRYTSEHHTLAESLPLVACPDEPSRRFGSSGRLLVEPLGPGSSTSDRPQYAMVSLTGRTLYRIGIALPVALLHSWTLAPPVPGYNFIQRNRWPAVIAPPCVVTLVRVRLASSCPVPRGNIGDCLGWEPDTGLVNAAPWPCAP